MGDQNMIKHSDERCSRSRGAHRNVPMLTCGLSRLKVANGLAEADRATPRHVSVDVHLAVKDR
jgi:hypothetical protein